MDEDSQTVILILVSLLFSAFFSGAEIAFVSANRLKIELDYKKGLSTGRILHYFVNHAHTVLAALLLGNTLALVTYGVFTASLVGELLSPWIKEDALLLIVQIILVTGIVLMTGEFLPKAFFRINPNRKLNWLAFPLLFFYLILYLPTLLTLGISTLILRVFGVKLDRPQQAFTRFDFDHYVKEINEKEVPQTGLENEIHILKNALEFSKVKARDCLVPRNEMEAIEVHESVDELRNKFIETGYSKLIVYRESIDHVLGYVHAFELFRNPATIRQILLPVFIVPENLLVKDLLPQFTKNKRGIAIVVDEFGGTSGMITIEDIIEEIFGEIQDEHDTDDRQERKLDDRTFLFSGRLEIDYLNEKYGLQLEENEAYETLAGYLLNKLEDLPKPNTLLETERFIFTILDVSDARIKVVRLRLKN